MIRIMRQHTNKVFLINLTLSLERLDLIVERDDLEYAMS